MLYCSVLRYVSWWKVLGCACVQNTDYCLQVEGAPTVVKKGLKKEEAEEIKKKLEAGVWPVRGK